MNSRHINRLLLPVILLTLLFTLAAYGESYSASTMRLLRFDGDVVIENPSGESRFVLENVRFSSGEAMRTGSGASASVALDDTKIVTLDENSRVEFKLELDRMELTLTEGTLFLDVSEKLDENEALDIRTSTMTVGIRGTIVVVSVLPEGEARSLYGLDAAQGPQSQEPVTVFSVLEGSASLTFADGSTATAKAGQFAVSGERSQIVEMAAENVTPFIQEQFNDNTTLSRVMTACPQLFEDYDFPADGDWAYTGKIRIIAQSASKLYDGTPLTRTGDILVYGLPEFFDITAHAAGSITDAGTAENPIGSYALFNSAGEDITAHFADIETVAGRLVVDPAPMTVWTGDAEKFYDGAPLTCGEAGFDLVSGHLREEPWRNLSLALSEETGEALYGLSGELLVHGTNPLTGETRQFILLAGEKLTVQLGKNSGEDSIRFEIETMSEEDIPEEVLRLYADNRDLLAQACEDTGWNEDRLLERISALPPVTAPTTTKDGLTVSVGFSGALMRQLADARIHVDSDITDYSGRPLTGDEAHFTEIRIDDSVKVTATGSQTEVGESSNTYEIDWGNENRNNFVISEDLGTLRVKQPYGNVVLTAWSESKIYDGAPLINERVSARGLPEGYKYTARVTGGQTDAGSSKNVIYDYTITDPDGRDVTADFGSVTLVKGTLTVEPAPLTVITGSAVKAYDGTALTSAEASLSGLVSGESVSVTATGSITDVGTAENSYVIDWGSVNSANYVLTEELGTLTVTKNTSKITVTSGSSTAVYTPYALTNHEVTTVGLPAGFTLEASVKGSQAVAGTSENTIAGYKIFNADGEDKTDSFTNVELVNGTLTVEPAPLTVTTGSAEKAYDGTALTSADASLSGLVSGESASVSASGSITDVGTAENSYVIDWGSVNSANYVLTEKLGTLTVTKNTSKITVTSGSSTAVYTPYALTNHEVTTTGLPASFTLEASVEGSQSVAGTSENTITGYKIFNADGEDRTDSFTNVELVNGTLTVTKAKIDVWSHVSGSTFETEATYTYRGSGYPFSCAWQGAYNADDPASSVIITDMLGGGWTEKDMGVYTLSFAVSLREDLNDKYELGSVRFGTITVTPASLTVSTDSASKAYDGKALTAGAHLDGLVGADSSASYTLTATGSITDLGTAENTYLIDWGEVNLANYTVTENLGTLTVTQNDASIVITAPSDTFIYSGEGVALMGGASVTGLPEGLFIMMTPTHPAIKDAGSYETGVSYYIMDEGLGKEVSDHFTNITVVPGTVTVEPLRLNIWVAGGSSAYDGEYHSANVDLIYLNGPNALSVADCVSYVTSEDGSISAVFSLYTGDTLTANVTGAGPEIGTYTLSSTYAISGTSSNYAVNAGYDTFIIE